MLTFLFIFIVSYIIYINWPKSISPPGSVLTEERIEKDLEILAGKDSFVWPIYFLKAEIPLNNIVEDKIFEQTSLRPEDQIIQLTIKSKKLFSTPYEVEYAMRVWNYLTDRQTPYPIEALYIYAYEGGLTGTYSIIVTIDEYELYQEYIEKGMTESEIVQLLTQKWIEKNNYSRWGLE